MEQLTTQMIVDRLRAAGVSHKRREASLDGHKHAGVLVPIIHGDDNPELLFTRRTETVETHKGQISFPGGVVDDSDRNIIHTALRETEEEVGIHHTAIEPLLLLDDHTTPTGFVITPVAGLIYEVPTLRPNPDEVAEILRLPIAFFADRKNGRSEIREVSGRRYEVWFYDIPPYTIWGATAAIVRSLLRIAGLLPADVEG